ncbi:hypothetical protein FT641_18475 [Bacillus paranthracis]|uniref:hypothetical protein n=1 Tax=Bacillus paranthracis TaxID=2026186 RepID=UPI0018793FC7|nr:hypothetical protein [Bacillus paranthracis]MBE7114450.1 hypothetical protein [Bacillus paranthracis]MBE7154676.1 hypothetical protein [Bacillus paranthracis]
MAAASVKVIVDGVVLRTHGGNRSWVRDMYNEYLNMTYAEFIKVHPSVTEDEFKRVQFVVKYNKKSRGGHPLGVKARLELKAINWFGDTYIQIKDKGTGNKVELTTVQLNKIVRSKNEKGFIPSGGWSKTGDKITVYNEDGGRKIEVTFTLRELDSLLS